MLNEDKCEHDWENCIRTGYVDAANAERNTNMSKIIPRAEKMLQTLKIARQMETENIDEQIMALWQVLEELRKVRDLAS